MSIKAPFLGKFHHLNGAQHKIGVHHDQAIAGPSGLANTGGIVVADNDQYTITAYQPLYNIGHDVPFANKLLFGRQILALPQIPIDNCTLFHCDCPILVVVVAF